MWISLIYYFFPVRLGSLQFLTDPQRELVEMVYDIVPFVFIPLDTHRVGMRPFHEDEENVHDTHIQARTRELLSENKTTTQSDIKMIYDIVKRFPQHKSSIKQIAMQDAHYHNKPVIHILHSLVMKATKEQLHHLDTIFFKEFDNSICVGGMITRMFEAMQIHDPQSLPVPHGQLMQEMLQSAQMIIEEEQMNPKVINKRLTAYLQQYQKFFDRSIADIVESWDLPSLYE